MDARETIYGKLLNNRREVASVTKIMTALVAFEKIKNGTLAIDQEFLISKKALHFNKCKAFLSDSTLHYKKSTKHKRKLTSCTFTIF